MAVAEGSPEWEAFVTKWGGTLGTGTVQDYLTTAYNKGYFYAAHAAYGGAAFALKLLTGVSSPEDKAALVSVALSTVGSFLSLLWVNSSYKALVDNLDFARFGLMLSPDVNTIINETFVDPVKKIATLPADLVFSILSLPAEGINTVVSIIKARKNFQNGDAGQGAIETTNAVSGVMGFIGAALEFSGIILRFAAPVLSATLGAVGGILGPIGGIIGLGALLAQVILQGVRMSNTRDDWRRNADRAFADDPRYQQLRAQWDGT
jgi:hypothetical protein